MAFTETEKISIVRITGVSLGTLNSNLLYLGTDITPEVEVAVRKEIGRWNSGAGTNFTRIHPRESNKGIEINPDQLKASILRNILNLLYLNFAELPSGQTRLVRS